MNVTDVSLILAILPLHSEEPLNFPRIDTVLAGPFLLHAGVELHITSVPVGIRRGLMGPMSK